MPYDSRESLMSTPMDQFTEQGALPAGHYYGQIMRAETTNVGANNTDVLDYYCQLISAEEDVPAADIADINLRDYELRARFIITKKAMFRLRAFHASLGFDESQPAEVVVPETTGMQVLLTVSVGTYTPRGQTKARTINNVDEIVGAPTE